MTPQHHTEIENVPVRDSPGWRTNTPLPGTPRSASAKPPFALVAGSTAKYVRRTGTYTTQWAYTSSAWMLTSTSDPSARAPG